MRDGLSDPVCDIAGGAVDAATTNRSVPGPVEA